MFLVRYRNKFPPANPAGGSSPACGCASLKACVTLNDGVAPPIHSRALLALESFASDPYPSFPCPERTHIHRSNRRKSRVPDRIDPFTFILRQHSAQSSLICAHRLRHHAMKLDLQRSKLPTAGLLTRRVTEGLVSVSLAVLLAGGPTPAALASTPTTLLAGGGRFLDGEAGLLWDEGTKTRMMEKATAAKEKVTHAHS